MTFDLSQAVRESIAAGGDGDALAFAGRWRSWRWIGDLARAIDTIVARAGDNASIALVARTRPQHVAAVAAQVGARRRTAMIYAAQSPAGIAADIAHIGAAVVIADAEDWSPEARAAAAEAGAIGVALTDGDGDSSVTPIEGLDRSAPAQHPAPSPEIAFDLLSSGTTGAPRRIPLSWAAISSAVADAKTAYVGTGARDAPMIMNHPLGNVSGVSYVVPPLAYGQRLVLMEKFAVAEWAALIEAHRPARASLPPAGVRMVLDAAVPPAMLASLSLVAVGGGKLDLDVQDAFEARYGIPILTAFGATEFGGVVANWTIDAYRQYGAAKRGSAGRASANVALRVVDRESFAPLPPDKVGLLEAKVDRIGPDWIRTSDLASIDADGFLFLHGRADRAINRGGFKIVPDAVAEVMKQHPAVADAAVIGLPDARLGEVPAIAIELVRGADPVDGAALKDWLRERLVAYQVPVVVRIVDALPRNASMKISFPEIPALFAGQAS